jgi:hypothetical protein
MASADLELRKAVLEFLQSNSYGKAVKAFASETGVKVRCAASAFATDHECAPQASGDAVSVAEIVNSASLRNPKRARVEAVEEEAPKKRVKDDSSSEDSDDSSSSDSSSSSSDSSDSSSTSSSSSSDDDSDDDDADQEEVKKTPAPVLTPPVSGGKRSPGSGTPFRRVDESKWSSLNDHNLLKDNSYKATFGEDGWGHRASEKLMTVRGKDFRHEKTKKKRGGYRGGAIDPFAVNSVSLN